MGKHTSIAEQELGNRLVVTSLTDLPSIETMRRLVQNFDDSMRFAGLDPANWERQAILLVERHNVLYCLMGWRLPAGPR